nr:MAG TPA: Biotin/lipoate A/B protein ligase family [Caudoviricetes sp.]
MYTDQLCVSRRQTKERRKAWINQSSCLLFTLLIYINV